MFLGCCGWFLSDSYRYIKRPSMDDPLLFCAAQVEAHIRSLIAATKRKDVRARCAVSLCFHRASCAWTRMQFRSVAQHGQLLVLPSLPAVSCVGLLEDLQS